ncbi:hypothetical protein BV25DRAFT_1989608 [Artomyces pyxidatus]|uniref:Uncharacterized protein n=1 Tax=Artomyces pyxidatus TaxID=48021 RepID=A0ACB8T8J2_9AGAM|nr:hypothetical protein BV25DRAFT_1989608 [Artomyces pyxidatus]
MFEITIPIVEAIKSLQTLASADFTMHDVDVADIKTSIMHLQAMNQLLIQAVAFLFSVASLWVGLTIIEVALYVSIQLADRTIHALKEFAATAFTEPAMATKAAALNTFKAVLLIVGEVVRDFKDSKAPARSQEEAAKAAVQATRIYELTALVKQELAGAREELGSKQDERLHARLERVLFREEEIMAALQGIKTVDVEDQELGELGGDKGRDRAEEDKVMPGGVTAPESVVSYDTESED